MDNEALHQPTFDGEAEKPWRPSASLHSGLLLGTLAVLVGGGLSVAATAVALAQDNPFAPGFTWAAGLNLASNAALIVLMLIYRQLGAETDRFNVRKTSIGLVLALVTFSVLAFADTELLPQGWVIAALVVAALGLVAMLIWAFASPTAEKPPSPEEAKTEASDKAKAGAGMGGVAILVLLAIKFGARLIWRQGLGLDEYVGIAWLALSLLTVIYLIWFGVALIRLSKKLGVLALLVGLFAILIPLVIAGTASAFVIAVLGLQQPNLNDQQLDKAIDDLAQEWFRTGALVQIVLQIIWTLLTAFFFVTLRNRYEPDEIVQPAAE